MQPFVVTEHVMFTYVADYVIAGQSATTETVHPACYQSKCAAEAFYPLTGSATSRTTQYNIALALLLLIMVGSTLYFLFAPTKFVRSR